MLDRYQQMVRDYSAQLGRDWVIVDDPTRLTTWRFFRHAKSALPFQGWKIHLSASAPEAITLLQMVAPSLVALDASFKLPLDIQGILHLNSGLLGRTQVGKVVTIYPVADDHCRAIVGELRELWPCSQGPSVPTDWTVVNCPAISVRFGAFAPTQVLLDELGQPYPILQSPDGHFTPDVRASSPQPPAWAPDSPVEVIMNTRTEAPISADYSVDLGDKQYIVVAYLSSSVSGMVALAVSADMAEPAIIKIAQKRIGTDLRGYDAADRLRNEFFTLRLLEENGDLAPCPFSLHECKDWTALVMEDISGDTLKDLVSTEKVESLAPLAGAIAALHEMGVAHRDIKLSNAIRTKQGQVKLIDYGLAAPLGVFGPLGGTAGHVPPEGTEVSASRAQDIYALGGCIAHALLNYRPALLPIQNNAGRLVGFLNLIGAYHGARLVRMCMNPDPGLRPTASQAEHWIRSSEWLLHRDLPTQPLHTSRKPPDLKWVRRVSTEAGLATRLFMKHMSPGHCWRNAHLHSYCELEAINVGAAGVILGLLSLEEAYGSLRFANDIVGGCKWLAANRPAPVAHGLFTGNAGVALALSAAGVRFADQHLREASRERLIAAVKGPTKGYDLFSGAAGIVFAGVLMYQVLQEDWPLEIVEDKASTIVEGRQVVDGVICWPSSPLYDRTQVPYFGAAHGASGVAMALALWAEATSQPRLKLLAADVFSTIFNGARSASGTTIQESTHRKAVPPHHWCHGVAGYLWCLLQAFGDSTELPVEKEWAAASFLSHATLVGNPTFCHGLAGNLGLMRMLSGIECYRTQVTDHITDTVQALRLLHLRQEGLTVWLSEDPRNVTPDLLVGFLGPATELALYAARRTEALLSGNWLTVASRPPQQLNYSGEIERKGRYA